MTDTNVKSKWKLTSIEYAGLGDTPYFVLKNVRDDYRMNEVKET